MMLFSPTVDNVIHVKISLKHSVYDLALLVIARNGSHDKTIGSAEASFSSKDNNIAGL